MNNESIMYIVTEMLKRGADGCEVIIGNSKFTATIDIKIKNVDFKNKADAEA